MNTGLVVLDVICSICLIYYAIHNYESGHFWLFLLGIIGSIMWGSCAIIHILR